MTAASRAGWGAAPSVVALASALKHRLAESCGRYPIRSAETASAKTYTAKGTGSDSRS
jgi:hypothetical protein